MTPSSPILFPSSSPAPQRTKRPRQNEPPRAAAAPPPRMVGGFMVDDSDDDEDSPEPVAKKRMTEPQGRASLPPVPDDIDLQFPTTGSLPGSLPDAQPDLPQLLTQSNDELVDFSQISSLGSGFAAATRTYTLKTCNGSVSTIGTRKAAAPVSYESMVAARSKTKEGRAKREYYGIEIHELTRLASLQLEQQKEARQQRQEMEPDTLPTMNGVPDVPGKKSKKGMLWTEKYRARKFTDLCGDDGTNRLVLRWIKRWDPIVFPSSAKPKPKPTQRSGDQQTEEEKPHKKILLLTGPPGLGKTTLAHVCARQAGYEIVEINASDDRSKNVVNNRIRTSLGTENVKTVTNVKQDSSMPQKPARPVCVVVDEVDGVTTGSGASGEGGFIKALIDLVLLDQKNAASTDKGEYSTRKKKKTDDFRQRRPLILICNDVYHPSLRPLRQSTLADIIHVGKPTIDAVVGRLSLVFEREGISCEKDAARKLCEAAWGMSSGTVSRRGAESTVQGDLRGVMVVGEWVAGRYRTAIQRPDKLTRHWVEKHVIQDLATTGARGMGRGGTRDVVSRVFQEGAGFPRQAPSIPKASKHQHEQPKEQLGFSEFHKRNGMAQLQQMVDTSGEVDRIMADIISEYPTHEFNDDCYLTKPNEAYDWFHFLDSCSTRLYSGQEWELAPYMSQPVLACHDLFASSNRHNAAYDDTWGADEDGLPRSRFYGPRASYNAHEAEKHNRAALQAMQADFSPSLGRLFRSPEDLATDFIPYLTRLVSPAVNPVVVGGSKGMSTASVRKEGERQMVSRAAAVMADVGLTLQKGKLDGDPMTMRGPQFVYRMEP